MERSGQCRRGATAIKSRRLRGVRANRKRDELLMRRFDIEVERGLRRTAADGRKQGTLFADLRRCFVGLVLGDGGRGVCTQMRRAHMLGKHQHEHEQTVQ